MAKKQTYYVTIKGKKLDRSLVELADSATSGKRDGRISVSDAKKLLNAVKDNNTYTDIEKKTMEYIRENYKFTDKADEWFRTEIRKWAAEKSAHSSKAISEENEYTTQDEAISLVVPHGADFSAPNYSGYIPTPSAGKPKKGNALPVLILSLIILVGFGIGIYYAFRKPSSESAKANSAASSHQEKSQLKKMQEKETAETRKNDSGDGGVFSFFSKTSTYQEAAFSGKDEELAKKIQASPVIFEKNDISVGTNSRKTLDALTGLLKRNPDVRVLLTGHASMEGSEEVNQKVSQLRAEMVRDYVLGNDIQSTRILLEAKGSSELKTTSEDKKQSHLKHRRVDIRLVK